jgi:hypothetical protein
MTTLERSVFINASVDAIQAVTLDGWRLPEWYAGVQQVEPDGVYPQPGGAVQMVYKAAGINFNITMTALTLMPGEGASYQLDGMITGTNYWTFTPEGGGTWVTCRFEYEVPGGGLGQALDKLLVERMNTENLERSLNNLKALVEGG